MPVEREVNLEQLASRAHKPDSQTERMVLTANRSHSSARLARSFGPHEKLNGTTRLGAS